MPQQEIYIRPYKRTTIIAKKHVLLKDIADISAPGKIKEKIESICILTIKDTSKKQKFTKTIIEIIDLIMRIEPDISINNLGEMDSAIYFTPKLLKSNPFIEWIKIICVSFVIFTGATIAIMTYNTDTSLAKTFIILNKILTGKEVENPVFITIPYALGLAIGIVLFFNHLGIKKITDDPSPMQIQIDKYETEVEDSLIDSFTKKRREPKNG